jgi:arsenite methyltransferase
MHEFSLRSMPLGSFTAVISPGGRLLLADAMHTDAYAATLRRSGAQDVAVRPLGWRVWHGGPWFGLSMVTARKP